MDPLREQVMVNQFTMVAGCGADQARTLLQTAHWQFETALSLFFQEAPIPAKHPIPGGQYSLVTPCNTPATPPNFPETLLAFSKMSAGPDKNTSPMAGTLASPSSDQQPNRSSPFSSTVQPSRNCAISPSAPPI